VVTLGRLCHEQLGMTPMTLINARLILEAKRELAHSAQSVKQIAHGMGFPMSVTSAVFRKHAQRSPSEFRLQAQAQHTGSHSPALFRSEASLLSVHDSPPTSLTLWQSDGPSF
jgi:AraC family transcriptional activator of pobA